jgi:hypothetical protein
MPRGDCWPLPHGQQPNPPAAFYENMMDTDKGPRPYFIDELHPPIYVDGKRIESPKYGSPDPEEPESCDLQECECDTRPRFTSAWSCLIGN